MKDTAQSDTPSFPSKMPVSARHIARELALLSLSQLVHKRSIEQVTLADLLEKAVRLLISEAEDCLKTAGKELEEADENLAEAEHLRADLVAELRKADREGIIKRFDQIQEHFGQTMKSLHYSLELVNSSMDIPLFGTLSGIPEVRGFAMHLVTQFRDHREAIDTLIDQVSPEWPVERMNSIDRDTIRLAVGEMLYDRLTPLPVIINEAVELSKKYGTPDSYRFVNGVLKNILEPARQQREVPAS